MSAIYILLANPFAFAAYIVLILSLIGCWVMPKYYLFAPLYVISYSLAYMGGVVSEASLIPLVVILGALFFLRCDAKRFIHLFSSMVIAILGVCISMHILRGFHNLEIYHSITFGSSSYPINIYLNFDKVSLAIFLLGLYIPLLRTKDQWRQMILVTVPLAAVTIFVLFAYSKVTGLLALDIKFPSISLIWLIVNLFFVTIPEEAFYRGFLQREITRNLPNKAGPILAILTVSLLFAMIHLLFIPNFYFILGVFITSIFYGAIYHFTGSIESSSIAHFAVNVCHFFFFSYPLA